MENIQLNQYLENQTSTNKLLKVIIALLLRQKEEESVSLKRQIEILDGLGMRPADIADTLGRTASHVNKELSGLRKNRKKSD
jgi:hypothetical protein